MKEPRENCDIKFVFVLELDLIADNYLLAIVWCVRY
jgi:hypothetical protein